jgi:hypothetical protein
MPDKRVFHKECMLQVHKKALIALGEDAMMVDDVGQTAIDSFMRRRGNLFRVEPGKYTSGRVTPVTARPDVPVGITRAIHLTMKKPVAKQNAAPTRPQRRDSDDEEEAGGNGADDDDDFA